ncbi:hypothetical protein [Haloplanus rubicundus]|uniref:hypothetical protein n=1 Tax=Haloplanus rubicundus TaxID=1547898 RepID=UPI001300295A|nr:hypothetical protein [Haloplanus rubicundus]
MRPNIDEKIIDELTMRADQVMTVDAEDVSVEQRLKAVLSTIDDLDGDPNVLNENWYDSKD